MNIIRVNDYEEMSDEALKVLVEQLKKVPGSVLGLATGSTPEGLYQRLIEEYSQGNITFKDVTTFNLDEYVGLGGDNPSSYRYYMYDKLFSHVDLPASQTFLPSGIASDLDKECREYDELIRNAGSIDVQILGVGVNGHIGFNEPGTPFDSRTHVVNLSQSTREANARFFPSLDHVPQQGITMGIETIMESEQILFLASGEKKADAINKLVNGDITEDVPLSVLQKHPRATIIADKGALSKT